MAVGQQVDDFWNWLRPRVAATFGRFPIAILLQLAATILAILAANDWLGDGQKDNYYSSLAVMTAAIFALAGSMFTQSRPRARVPGLILSYGLPLLVLVAFFFSRHDVSAPVSLLMVVGLLWLSVSSSTQVGWGGSRPMVQDRFWWINHQSAIGAAVCLIALGVVTIGIFVIDATLRSLFNFSPSGVYNTLLISLTLFVAPVLWLSTIPRTADFLPSYATVPDNVARAVGALAQFVATPLLFIYTGILLIYLVQIVVTWTLPQNTISWMVLTCTIVGTLNWLLLHPSFQHDKLLVRLYRVSWLWLMMPPLALYGLSVFVRIEDYGLTPDRILLLAGFVWAGLVVVTHIVGLGDVRLIPALGAVVLLVISVGPLNYETLTRFDQTNRLEALLDKAGVQGFSMANAWSDEDAERAESLMYYLDTPTYRAALYDVLQEHGISMNQGDYPSTIVQSILRGEDLRNDPSAVAEPGFRANMLANPHLDLSATPIYLGDVAVYRSQTYRSPQMDLSIDGAKVVVSPFESTDPADAVTVDLSVWLERQGRNTLEDGFIDFRFEGRDYRIVLKDMAVEPEMRDGQSIRQIGSFTGMLFGAAIAGDLN